MASATRNTLLVLVVIFVLALLAAGGFVWSGAYNVAADDHHTRPVRALLETLRERSIAARASRLQPPGDLLDPARIIQGAGNYDAMCMGCHLAPGMSDTELSRGLSPAPPNLSRTSVDAAQAFWVIKHGIKASGMPAWGRSMDDAYIWNMAAFLQELPRLGPAQYQAMVDSSGGHDHGGGETGPHDHGEARVEDHGEMPAEAMPVDEGRPHAHPPGTPADHHRAAPAASPAAPAPAAPEPEAATEADDDHQHQH